MSAEITAWAVSAEALHTWRDGYRAAMNAQIVRDSIHVRPGWTREYLIGCDGETIGYGSVAVAGPWSGTPTLYEFHLAATQRIHAFDACRAVLVESGAKHIEAQSNDELAMAALFCFARHVTSESILFRDEVTTTGAPPGASFRLATPADLPKVPAEQLPWHGIVECEGEVAGHGGILFHYNPPFGDVYMEVAEPFHGRGLGAYLVQELKRVCRAGGFTPTARCQPSNVASRRTLQRAGFVPYGHILKGSVARELL